MSRLAPWFHRFVLSHLLVVSLLLVGLRPATAQQARPEPGLLPSPNPLCDGVAVPCLDIDELAVHAYANLQVLPSTDQRDTTASSARYSPRGPAPCNKWRISCPLLQWHFL